MRTQGFASQAVKVVDCIDPDAYTASTVDGGPIDMAKYQKVMFVVMAGTFGTDGTIDFKVTGDTASGGSYATDITGKAITQLTDAGTDDDKQAIVEVSSEEVVAQGLRFIRGELTIATATSDAGVLAIGFGSRYSSTADATTVDEIVA